MAIGLLMILKVLIPSVACRLYDVLMLRVVKFSHYCVHSVGDDLPKIDFCIFGGSLLEPW